MNFFSRGKTKSLRQRQRQQAQRERERQAKITKRTERYSHEHLNEQYDTNTYQPIRNKNKLLKNILNNGITYNIHRNKHTPHQVKQN